MDIDSSDSTSGDHVSRYCLSDDPAEQWKKTLEAKVARNPEDTDAWLLLAIHQLDFDVKLR